MSFGRRSVKRTPYHFARRDPLRPQPVTRSASFSVKHNPVTRAPCRAVTRSTCQRVDPLTQSRWQPIIQSSCHPATVPDRHRAHCNNTQGQILIRVASHSVTVSCDWPLPNIITNWQISRPCGRRIISRGASRVVNLSGHRTGVTFIHVARWTANRMTG